MAISAFSVSVRRLINQACKSAGTPICPQPSGPDCVDAVLGKVVDAILDKVGASPNDVAGLAHGTTVATNGLLQAPISELVTTGFRHLLEMPAYRCRSANEAVGSLSQLTILVHFLHERGNRDFGPCRSSLLYLAGASPLFYRIAYLLVFFVSLTLIRQGIAGLETTNGRTIWTTLH